MKAIKMKSKKHDDKIINHETQESYRLNKYISDSGLASRREADRLIEQGLVTINGIKAEIGQQVFKNDVVSVKGETIRREIKRVYIMLNKPRGITTTNDLEIKGNIRAFVNYPELIFPIGRLDKDSSGLILLTNDGDIVNKILRAEYGHEKEYVVTVDKTIDDNFIKELEKGVKIYNPVSKKYQMTEPAKIMQTNHNTFKIIIKQGLNRQIRRMTKALGYTVKSLRRIRIINLSLKDLEVGKWRYLTTDELIQLNNDINS